MLPFALLGRVVTRRGVIEHGAVVVDGVRLAWVGRADAARAAGWGDVVAAAGDSAGLTLVPGLVDLHCHGAGGVGFPDASDEPTARLAALEHLRRGTTTVVASLVTAPVDVMLARAAMLAEACRAGDVAGVHLEGPFLAPRRSGAQDPRAMLLPNAALVRDLLEGCAGHVVSMTVAPELPGARGAGGVIEVLAQGGAVPSFGHTDCAPAVARDAVAQARVALGRAAESGRARSLRPTVTHLFNSMPPIHHRTPGPGPTFLAAAAEGGCVVELVGDGVHLDPDLVRDVFALVGADAIALVSDATAAAGLPDGASMLGGRAVTVTGGVARLDDGGAIAGSTAFLLDGVRRAVATGVPLADAVRAAATTPAEVLGDPTIGALEPGRRADVVVLDDALRVRQVFRAGVAVTAA